MSDANGFFQYPGHQPPGTAPVDADTDEFPAVVAGLLENATEGEWATVLAFTQTRHLRAGEELFREGQTDRALYLLTGGRVELSIGATTAAEVEPPAPLNEIAFLDRGICAASARAQIDSEVLRLSFEAFETLAARDPVLARKLLLDLARLVAAALRTV